MGSTHLLECGLDQIGWNHVPVNRTKRTTKLNILKSYSEQSRSHTEIKSVSLQRPQRDKTHFVHLLKRVVMKTGKMHEQLEPWQPHSYTLLIYTHTSYTTTFTHTLSLHNPSTHPVYIHTHSLQMTSTVVLDSRTLNREQEVLLRSADLQQGSGVNRILS